MFFPVLRPGFRHYTIQKYSHLRAWLFSRPLGCDILKLKMVPYSLYFHVPFCRQRCYYCDFNTFAGMERWIPAYTSALCIEIEKVASQASDHIPVHTLFFGGGTPSLLGIEQYQAIFRMVHQHFKVLPESEISLEANPGTVSLKYLKALRDLGFNRLSLGMQSANPEELRLMGRIHDTAEVIQAVKWARQAGFNNLNLDLIFGLPSQTMSNWQNSIELALGLNPEHLSMYALTIEEGTPFFFWSQRGMIASPDDDLAADMYEWAGDRLEGAGYSQYEISNWARVGKDATLLACRHNLQYWRSLPYLGFGPGAHGFAQGIRTANVGPIPAYIDQANKKPAGRFPIGPAVSEARPIDLMTEMQETMMVGLRLVQEGVSMNQFVQRFNQPLETVFGEPINRLTGQGLLEQVDGCLRLTKHGRLLGNRVFMEFV
jgi:oxygen-independent coproporphyrinogen III oxidase